MKAYIVEEESLHLVKAARDRLYGEKFMTMDERREHAARLDHFLENHLHEYDSEAVIIYAQHHWTKGHDNETT